MRVSLLAQTILFALILFTLPARPATHPADSLLDIKEVQRLMASDPDQALSLLEKVREQKQTPQFKIDWVTYQIYAAKRQYRLGIAFAKRTLSSDSLNADTRKSRGYYLNMCKNLIFANDAIDDYEGELHYANEMLTKMTEFGYPEYEKHLPYSALANVQREIGDKEKAYKLKQKAIALIRQACRNAEEHNTGNAYPLLYLSQYYAETENWLMEDCNYEAALQTALEHQTAIAELEKRKGGNLPQGIPEPYVESIVCTEAGFIASCYQLLGRPEEEKKWFDKFRSSSYSESEKGLYRSISYYTIKKNYPEVIRLALKIKDIIKPQEDIETEIQVYKTLADAYEKTHDLPNAIHYQKESLALTDSLNKIRHKNDALEMATLYETREKELQIERQEDTLQHQRTLLAGSGALIFLLGLVLYLSVRNWRTVRRKNIAMVRQIQEQLAYSKNIELQLNRLQQEEDATDALEDTPESLPGAQVPRSFNKEKQLFAQLRKLIVEEKLYANPGLTRNDVCTLLATNRNTLNSVLQQYTGTTFIDYVNNHRLMYVLEQLVGSNDTIEVIAENAGFGSARTLYRLFRQKYGMSPTDYKNVLLEEEKEEEKEKKES